MKLTKIQQEIVENASQAIMVTAPAGAGKTEVMARRAIVAVNDGAKSVLCLTFTNRAANSMNNRIKELNHSNAKINVYTFHAFCNSLLRKESKNLGLPYNYTILDEEDTGDIIKELLALHSKSPNDNDIRVARTFLDQYTNAKLIHKDKKDSIEKDFSKRFNFDFYVFYNAYHQILQDSNSLDFASLISLVFEFLSDELNLSRWQSEYDCIQVDEMQDTSLAQYDIFSKLAAKHKNLSLFGDINQTIYEWRDSKPFEIIKKYKQSFAPKQYSLVENFRSTKNITQCAQKFLNNYYNRATENITAIGEKGDKVHLCFLKDQESEKKQICRIIDKLKAQIDFKDIAVLTRTNFESPIYSNALNENNIPTYLVDEKNFFRREEIKDALALLKMVQNSSDIASVKRILLKYAENIGETTISTISNSTLPISIEDFVSSAHRQNEDFFDHIISSYRNNTMVIFDVESTGLDTNTDEILEIAAVKFGIDGIADEFHHYMTPNILVGSSQNIHGYTDEFLKERGEDPALVLNAFLSYSKGCILGGHNVTYDIAILSSQLERLNIDYALGSDFFDTLSASKRIIKDSDNYKLATLCAYLGIEEEPTHHAMDDVYATCELATACFDEIIESTPQRIEIYEKYKSKFTAFSQRFETLFVSLDHLRPVDFLKTAYEFLNIFEKFKASKNKVDNLKELVNIFSALDDNALSPKASLKKIIETLTLSNSCERLLSGENKVAVLTVHQAKGLQFNTVIIANAVDGSFPSYKNIKHDVIDEDARLFYVAMTRASKNLFITLAKQNDKGWNNKSSRFIKLLPKDHYIVHSQV
jgi:DNA helicase II / ATP-dependent DNA helicase PcrA